MTRRYSPTARRRRLSAILRQLRHEQELTLEGATERLEWSRGRLAHMESNKWVRPDLGNIRQLLDLYKVHDDDRREAILSLARQSRQRGWWARYSDVFGSDTFVGFESEASVISSCQPIVIPGILQTPGYAKACARDAMALSPAETERLVESRLARQEILAQEDAPLVWAVIDESALHRATRVEGVARDQIRHLIAVAREQDNVTVQIMPFSAGLHPGAAGPFVILDFPGEVDPSMVYLETSTDGLFLEEPDEISNYKLAFDHVRVAARSQQESITLMDEILATL